MNASVLRPLATLPSPQPAFRFRLHDSDTWREGQVEDLSAESLRFLTDLPLEIGTELELALPLAALAPLRIHGPWLRARVTERRLDCWPDLRTEVTATFESDSGVVGEGRLAGAA